MTSQYRRFEGKVAIVSGGADGMGAACVEQLALEGARVFALDVKYDMAKALAASAKTITAPERMPGMTCGSTMRRSTVKGPAPSATAAFSTCGSSRCSDAQTASTM